MYPPFPSGFIEDGECDAEEAEEQKGELGPLSE